MNRVMVIGCPGSGKSTFSRVAATRLDLPLVHLDHHFWRPGWNRLSSQEWHAEVETLIAKDRWLQDGNYTSSMPIRVARADTVVFLDMPRWRCLWRIMCRHVRAPEMAPGCPHRVTPDFLRFVWRFPRHSRPGVNAALSCHATHTTVVRLRHPRDVRDYLETLRVG